MSFRINSNGTGSFSSVTHSSLSTLYLPLDLLSSAGPSGGGAHDRIRTGDLFLTKEVLYRLSYMGPLTPSIPQSSQSRLSWSGKRDSNPRPSAWKADALPTELFPPWILVRFPLHASWWRGKDSNLRRL